MKKFALLPLAFFVGSAFAGYAQVSPPSNYSTVNGVAMYKAASNDVSFVNGVRGSAGVINVAGRSLTMPAAYRFAANAGGAAARGAFGNPYLFIGIAAGTAIYDWYNSSGYVLEGGVWKKSNPYACLSNCYEYLVSNIWYPHMQLAANAQIGKYINNGYPSGNGVITSVEMQNTGAGSAYRYKIGAVNYTSAWYAPASSRVRTPDASATGSPATQAEFEASLGSKPIPAGLPQLLPDPLPVEAPVLNPSADVSPVSVPMRVPTGNPSPIANTNPQQYRQPVVDITPVPTPAYPWQVDEQTSDIISTSPTPLPETAPVPATPASGTTQAPTEFKTCGLPGSPACKIDETGTPTEKKLEIDPALKTTSDANRDVISGGGDKTMFQRFGALFTLPPLTQCGPVQYPDVAGIPIPAMDICPGGEKLRTMMGFIWAVAGLAFCWACINEVI